MHDPYQPVPHPGHAPQEHPPEAADCPPDHCDPNAPDIAPGPVREAGGTTGAGNLSPGGASRTGGATTGVPVQQDNPAGARDVPPDA